MPEIVITIPQIDPQMFESLEAAQTQAHESELAAVRAIREKFAVAAKHGQNIKTASWQGSFDEDVFFRKNGKLVKGWKIVNFFSYDDPNSNGSTISGTDLWLTEGGWVEQEFAGEWSRFSDSVDWWCAGDTTPRMEDSDSRCGRGYTKYITDEQANEYKLADILKGVEKAVAESKDRVPKRIQKLQEQIAVAQGVAAALA